MRDHPIIFSAPMVRALLEGRKTQTRRLAWRPAPVIAIVTEGHPTQEVLAPSPWQRVLPGERLWVRETWKAVPACAYAHVPSTPNPSHPAEAAVYRAGWDRSSGGVPWRPSIHMPRWASRLTLTVTDVRVQRLQEISEADAEAEGVIQRGGLVGGWWVPGVEHQNRDFPILSRPTRREMFAALWDVVHGSGAWLSNPEVVALTFTCAARNIDA
jgi:hypothetical protein